MVDILPFTDNLLTIANILSTSYYDFDLEHWNLSKNENETLQEYASRLTKHPAWNTKNSIAWDSSIQGAKELNDILLIDPDIYYFSSSTELVIEWPNIKEKLFLRNEPEQLTVVHPGFNENYCFLSQSLFAEINSLWENPL